ncbi:MAG: phosphotransferase [Pseudomonadota bacterium]
MIETFSAAGTFFKGNLHCHSTNSDGQLSPQRVCHFYREAGYDFICLSDHFVDKYSFPVTDTSAYRTEEFTTIIGAEVHSGETEAGDIWHILAVGLPLDFAHTPADESGPALAQRALDAGAFVALPHPEWYGITIRDGESMPEGIHAIEMFNAVCDAMGREGGGYLLDQMMTSGRTPGAIAVDDAHYYRGDAALGWTMVKAEERTPDALLAALKAGHYYGSTGPEIYHVETDGTHLFVECSPVAFIGLVGKGAAHTKVEGQNLTRAMLPLEPFVDGWARLNLRTDDGQKAWGHPWRL